MFGPGSRRERAAAKWLARMGNEGAAFDRAEFERWRGRSPANARAFEEAATSWGLDLPIAATRYVEGRDAGLERARRPAHAGLAALAAVVLAVVAGVSLHYAGLFDRHPHGRPAQIAEVSTGAGEARTFRLIDGSVATLGAGSALRIAFVSDVRRLTLLRGHARFDVAHDADRPFRVYAGRGVITAHGTIFDVRIAPDGVDVLLVRGAIDVERAGANRAAREVRRLQPGQRVRVPETGPLGPVESTPLARAQADAGAMLEFDRTPLAEAVATLNRRNARKILIEDARTGAKTISGGFKPDDPGGFADMMAAMFDLVVARAPSGDLLLAAKR